MQQEVASLTLGKLIIDTGPLWDFLLMRCVRELGWQSVVSMLRANKQHTFNTDLYERKVTGFLSAHKPIYTTPGVIAEINGDANDFKGKKSTFWTLARNELLQLGIDDKFIKFAEIQSQRIIDLGYVDASLIEIAIKEYSYKCTILTDDDGLLKKCKSANIHTICTYEIIYSAES